MKRALKNMNFDDHKVRAFILPNGNTWWALRDICNILGIKNPTMVLKRIPEDDHTKIKVTKPSGFRYDLNMVSEPGMYSVILGSRKEAAQNFKSWVTGSAIPRMRKTLAQPKQQSLPSAQITLPSNGVSVDLTDPRTVSAVIQALNAKVQNLESKIEEMRGPYEYCQKVLKAESSISISEIASMYGVSSAKLNLLLQQLGIQHKINNRWTLYNQYRGLGYTTYHSYVFTPQDKKDQAYSCMHWTEKGKKFIFDTLKEHGILPLHMLPEKDAANPVLLLDPKLN